MVKIAICDDIEDICLGMKYILDHYTFSEKVQVDYFCSGVELYNNFIKNKYDLILLDIELSEDDKENGMLISQKIKSLYPDVLVIFFTGQLGYERKLLNFEPFRFLEKPVWEDDLVAAVNSAIDRLRGWEIMFYPFKINGINMQIEINKIIWFMSQSPYVIIKCVDEEVKFRGKIDNVEKTILKMKMSSDFIRPSKSFLVNKRFVKSQSSKEILVTTGDTITITRKYAKKFNENKE